jgi:hypothetical protein
VFSTSPASSSSPTVSRAAVVRIVALEVGTRGA